MFDCVSLISREYPLLMQWTAPATSIEVPKYGVH
jgi:hypothetical protein